MAIDHEKELEEIFRRANNADRQRNAFMLLGVLMAAALAGVALKRPEQKGLLRTLLLGPIVVAVLALLALAKSRNDGPIFQTRKREPWILGFARANREAITLVRWERSALSRSLAVVVVATSYDSARSYAMSPEDARRAALLFHGMAPNATFQEPDA